MKINRRLTLLSSCLFVCLALPAFASDRVHSGQWETILKMAGRTMTMSACVAQSEADAMNGDVKSIRAIVEKTTAPTGCTVQDVKVNGGEVTVTSVCAGKKHVGTTTYHGDSSETTNSNGVIATSKRVGACK